MAGIRILGTGRSLPERIVENEEFAALVDTSDEWIRTRTGMRRRRMANGETAWKLGAEAARQALAQAEMRADELDLIITTTITPDFYFPSTACIIQAELEAKNAFAFDIGAACSGFPYALDMARRYLCTGDVKNVLIVSTEILSQVTDYNDRNTCVLFGDGAGACVVTACENATFGSYLHSDATGGQHIYAHHPRRNTPFLAGSPVEEALPFPVASENVTVMNGREVYKFATKAMPEAVERACERAGVAVADLRLLIPHQANLRIIETALNNLNMDRERCLVNIHDYGNTSSASVAIGLDECLREERVRRGDLVCIVGFGAGLTYGACVFEY